MLLSICECDCLCDRQRLRLRLQLFFRDRLSINFRFRVSVAQLIAVHMRQCHRLPVINVVSEHEPIYEPFPFGDIIVLRNGVHLCIPVRESEL